MFKTKGNRTKWKHPSSSRPRVLLECPSDLSPSIIATVIERHGMDVHICEGPADGGKCSLLDSGTCDAVNEADVVVNMLGQRRAHGRQIAEAVRTMPDGPALVIEASDNELARPDVSTEGATVLKPSFSARSLLIAIRDGRRSARA
ncbi:MAG: hypothetical protein WBD02_04290 [Acidimicrobiia bacterium]